MIDLVTFFIILNIIFFVPLPIAMLIYAIKALNEIEEVKREHERV